MKIYLVGISDPETNTIISVHKTYEGALKSWNKERLELIKSYRRMLFYGVARGHHHVFGRYESINLKNLSNEDPKQ